MATGTAPATGRETGTAATDQPGLRFCCTSRRYRRPPVPPRHRHPGPPDRQPPAWMPLHRNPHRTRRHPAFPDHRRASGCRRRARPSAGFQPIRQAITYCDHLSPPPVQIRPAEYLGLICGPGISFPYDRVPGPPTSCAVADRLISSCRSSDRRSAAGRRYAERGNRSRLPRGLGGHALGRGPASPGGACAARPDGGRSAV